jgi:hypothetical protein
MLFEWLSQQFSTLEKPNSLVYDSQGLLPGDFDFKKELNDHTLPIDLGIDNDENIYVLDTGNDLVYVLKKQKA